MYFTMEPSAREVEYSPVAGNFVLVKTFIGSGLGFERCRSGSGEHNEAEQTLHPSTPFVWSEMSFHDGSA